MEVLNILLPLNLITEEKREKDTTIFLVCCCWKVTLNRKPLFYYVAGQNKPKRLMTILPAEGVKQKPTKKLWNRETWRLISGSDNCLCTSSHLQMNNEEKKEKTIRNRKEGKQQWIFGKLI